MMGSDEAVPARVQFALTLLDPKPSERVMEVGCGPGLGTAEVCARVTTGSVVAIDRSATAIARTARRNASAITAGKLTTRCEDLAGLDLPPGSIDAAFAVDVNLFWTRDPAPELEVLRRVLRPGGRLVIAYGAGGPQDPARVLETVSAGLRAAGYRDLAVESGLQGFGAAART